jgi:hypothetical protein
MGLHFNSGPKWEDDSLNDLNIKSIEDNAKEMARKPGNPSGFWLYYQSVAGNPDLIKKEYIENVFGKKRRKK